MARKKAENAAGEPAPTKPPTKSDFIRKALTRNHNLKYETILTRWIKAGHPGTISKSLYAAIRSQLGIKTVWELVYTGPPREVPATNLPPGPLGDPQAHALGEVFQIRITLLDVEPPIWRQIEVRDATLDTLHEHIQSAMGWTNSHLHQFQILDERYSPPSPMGFDAEDLDVKDSTQVLISSVVKRGGKSKPFLYEYDFGDGWMHKIAIEGRIPADPAKEYPLCLDGARACPPEDCGGPFGYADLLEILADRKHPEYRDRKEWIGGKYNAEAFSASATTKRMRNGLPRPW